MISCYTISIISSGIAQKKLGEIAAMVADKVRQLEKITAEKENDFTKKAC
jgi:hypothetical protein